MKLLLSILLVVNITTALAQQAETIIIGTREREYYVHLPKNYEVTSALIPLVIGLHGANQQPVDGVNSYASMTGLNAKADAENFIVVYPVGLGSDVFSVPVWNAGKCCPPASSPNVKMEDVQFISALIDKLIATYHIHKSRVYATGFSNGAMMCQRLMCELSTKIAAVGAHSGSYMVEGECKPVRPVPMIYLHATKDSVVPYNGGTGVLSNTLVFPSVDSTMHIWQTILNCTMQEQSVFDIATAKGSAWQSSTSSTELQRYYANDGGHWWIGSPVGIGSKAFNATDIIWNFLKRFTLENPTDVFEQTEQQESNWIVFTNAMQQTILRFQTYQSNISIRVTDVLGREVIKQEQQQGLDIPVQTAQLPHGVYVLQITNGKTQQTKTILL